MWRKICHVEKFQISVKNLNNLWSFIEIYAVFVQNLCGEKITNNMRSLLWLLILASMNGEKVAMFKGPILMMMKMTMLATKWAMRKT